MELSVEKLTPALLIPSLSEPEIIQAIRKMSESFTSKRGALKNYLESEKMISAYALFYLPTNFKKLSFLLRQLPVELLHELKTSTLIDVGCGPGTYSLAWMDYFQTSEPLYAIETAGLMRDQAAKMFGHFFHGDLLKFLPAPYANSVRTRRNTLLFGNSINEMGHTEAMMLIEDIDPLNIVIIEPGTKESFRALLDLKQELVAQGYSLYYPCLSNAKCPMTEENWCHQIVKTTHDPSIERLSQMVSLDRREMPMTAFVFSRKKFPQSRTHHTVRALAETKFSLNFECCLPEGDKLKLVQTEILKKSLSKVEQKKILALGAGEALPIDKMTELKDGRLRLELKMSDE